MDEIGNKPEALRVEGGDSRKPYQQPKLTPLGSIHSLVRSTPGHGTDGNSHPSSSHS
jgi:hypothetical protein